MKQLAVVHPEFEVANPASKFAVNFFGERVNFVMDDCFPEKENVVLGDHEVLVKKKGFSLNYRDLNFIMKASRHFISDNCTTAYLPIGSEFVGEVEQTGKLVTGLQKGDRVIPNWNYEEIRLLKKRKSGLIAGVASNSTSKEKEILHFRKLYKIPETFPLEVAAGFSIGAQTGMSMLRKAKLNSKSTLLITGGSSNTSLFVLKMLPNFKYKHVYVLTSSTEKAQQLEKLNIKNATILVNTKSKDEDIDLSIVKILHNNIDAIIDPFCNIYLKKLYYLLKFNGRYVTCGIENNTLYNTPGIDTETMQLPENLLVHFIMNNISFTGNCLGTTRDLGKAVDLYLDDKLSLSNYHSLSYKNGSEFLEMSYNDANRLGKVVCMYE
jgi:NADPH:quinone reductase-like Zn-dependent oxidoreductase